MKCKTKKILLSFSLFLVIAIQTFCFPKEVYAKSNTYFKTKETQTAFANLVIEQQVTIPSTIMTDIRFDTNCNCGLRVEVYNTSEQLKFSYEITAEEAEYNDETGGYIYEDIRTMNAGKYIFKMTFDTSTNYIMNVGKYIPALNKNKATISSGFSTKLNAKKEKVKKWSTSNASIATVKNGTVTGKKPGKAKITATLKNGKKLTCNITVKENSYSEKKMKVSSTSYGRWGQVYKAIYSDGKLKLYVRFVNHTESNYPEIKDIHIIVKQKYDVVGEFYKKKIKTTVKKNSTKDYVFTIAKPYMKKADLRKVSTEVEFNLGSR